jgi:hypothetical protein
MSKQSYKLSKVDESLDKILYTFMMLADAEKIFDGKTHMPGNNMYVAL